MSFLKRHLRIFFSIALIFTITNCVTDDIISNEEFVEIEQPKYKIEKIGRDIIESNEILFEKLMNFRESGDANNFSSAREIHSEEYDFTVDTDMAIYLEIEQYHSYTFPIYPDEPNGLVQNLLLSVKEDGTYEAFLTSYDLSESQVEMLSNGEFVSVAKQMSMEKIDVDIDDILTARTGLQANYNGTRSYYYEVEGPNGHPVQQVINDLPCPGGMNPGDWIEFHDATDDGGGSSDPWYNDGNDSDTGNDSGGWTGDPNDDGTSTNGETGNTGGSGATGGVTIPDGDPVYTAPFVDILGSMLRQLRDVLTEDEKDWVRNEATLQQIWTFNQILIESFGSEAGKKELKLTIATLNSEEAWTANTGNYNNIGSLSYTHTRTLYINGVPLSQYRLSNGDVISTGDYGIWQDTSWQVYYYSRAISKWFQIPDPSNYDPLNLDFLWSGFWSATATTVRYATPLEDVMILIDGKDFDGVAQSRGVAGVFLVFDLVPGGKVLKVVKRMGFGSINGSQVLWKVATAAYKTQRRLIDEYKGIIETMSNLRKGNFGEMATDVDLFSKGYKRLHVNQINNIDFGGHTGLDHVFKNEVTGEFIVVESKYGSAGLNAANPATGLPRQMSDAWIYGDGALDDGNRLWKALGENFDLYSEVVGNFIRVKAKVSPDGSVIYKLIDSNGYVILGNAGIFVP